MIVVGYSRVYVWSETGCWHYAWRN
jgi:hypothetical protein